MGRTRTATGVIVLLALGAPTAAHAAPTTSPSARAVVQAGQPSTPAVVRGNTWHLRRALTAGAPDVTFTYGLTTDQPLLGDWDGDGVATPGVWRNGTWLLRNQLSGGPVERTVTFGRSGDIPVLGDWDGDGDDDLGVFRAGRWYLDIGLTGGAHERYLRFGRATDTPAAGDWNGGSDGRTADLPALRRGSTWYLETDPTPDGHHDTAFSYGGQAGDRPVVGRWQDGPGVDQVGVVRTSTWHLRYAHASGPANRSFSYGVSRDFFLTWGGSPQSLAQPVRHYRYRIGTKGTVHNSIEHFSDVARQTLNDQRAWSLGRLIRFSRDDASPHFNLWLATPSQVAAADPICDRQWSCRVGNNVYINVERWNHGTATWSHRPLAEYRQYVILHEVGHWLGLGHVGCPGSGQPAPVMMQQSIRLGGCVTNLWPLQSEKNRVYDRHIG